MREHYCTFLIFGATGDLTYRKLLPALYFLEQENLLKENFRIVCIARRQKSNEEYRKECSNSIKRFSRLKVNDKSISKLLSRIHYTKLEISNAKDYLKLKNVIEKISGAACNKCERIFYLAVPSSFFGAIANSLKSVGLAERSSKNKFYSRIVFEKPFGHDLESAKELNNAVIKVFDEKQIYRIDHYMAKELVQNLLVLRFANSIFEPLWNREYIEHIQITLAETIGVEGRGSYYDKAGAIRDVMQNHMMQLLALVAMSAPKSFDADAVKDEKVKALKSIKKFNAKAASKIAVTGQYSSGFIEERKVPAYREEPEISKSSNTETYVALKLEINSKIWKGVPFYLRAGKRLKEWATEIVIVYKKVPVGLFSKLKPANNIMIIRVQPYEGITLQFNAKVPGKKVVIDDVNMDFCHECKFGPNSPEAYERLLHDVMIGDQTLFTRWDEVEHSWKIFDALIKAFKGAKPYMYKAGAWGPKEADKLIEKDSRKWIEPKKPSYAELLGK